MNERELVVYVCCSSNWVNFAEFFARNVLGEIFHQRADLFSWRWRKTTDINGTRSIDSGVFWVNRPKYSLMQLLNVIFRDDGGYSF